MTKWRYVLGLTAGILGIVGVLTLIIFGGINLANVLDAPASACAK